MAVSRTTTLQTNESSEEYLLRLDCCSRNGPGAIILATEDTQLLAQRAERITLEWADCCDHDLHATLVQAKQVNPLELLIVGTGSFSVFCRRFGNAIYIRFQHHVTFGPSFSLTS